MLETIYTSTTGLQTFSKGLDVISNNVTNVNTVGYKATGLVYRDIHYNFSLQDQRQDTLYGTHIGHGVAADITSTLFNQGDLRQTGNDTDVAISGRGFFVIEQEDGYVYSRNGQFEFNNDGDLVTRDGGQRVMGLTESGALQAINQNPYKAQPAVMTSKVSLAGNLSTGSTTATTANVPIIDSLGGTHAFTITYTLDTTNPVDRAWKVRVTDENQAEVATGTINFQPNGSPAEGKNTLKFDYQASGATKQSVTLNFGDAGSFSNVTSFSGGSTSNVTVGTSDGRPQGSLLTLSFDEDGKLLAKYSNQQTETGTQLALADFDNLQALQQLGRGLFHAQTTQQALIGAPGKNAFGKITAGSVESSNIDLSTQFTDMIVVQRGYQASSQVLTVANEMLQQLLEGGRK
jgi:flagellar hook protein FlgE